MTVFIETTHTAEYLIAEAEGHLSREIAVVAAGAQLEAGAVLGRVLIGAVTAAAKSGGNTGNGTLVVDASTPFVGADPVASQTGAYAVRFVTATQLQLLDPRGVSLGAYAIGGSTGNAVTITDRIKFVVTQGATVFVAGDGFDVTVASGSGKHKLLAPSALDGSQKAAAILYDRALAASADVAATVTARQAEVNGLALIWPAGITAPQKAQAIADLAGQGIIVRN